MRCLLLGLRCARSKCCAILVVLAVIFVIGRVYQERKSVSVYDRNDRGKANQTKAEAFLPGGFLGDVLPRNSTYCKFRFGLPVSLDINDSDVQFGPEMGPESEYRVVYDVLESDETTANNVTYCTHATPEFVYYLAEVLRRWQGPVSVATFVPNTDASLVICLIERLCSCLPDMARVSLHFVYPSVHPPRLSVCPSSTTAPNCRVPPAVSRKSLQTYRNAEGLTYPVNVARNVARLSSKTDYTLVSDVELFPSKNLVPNFLRMAGALKRKSRSGLEDLVNRIVYVLPVFEVSTGLVPDVKSKLLELYSQNRAFYFHRWVCSHCQRFPGLQRWLLRRSAALDKTIQPFFVVRREFPFHRWEPVFIGTNSEPLYSELLTWEGQQDKMTQMHEMCLLKYHFVILDGAFLVHAPGVKRKADVLRDNWRRFHQKKNSLYYELIMKSINGKLKQNTRCRIH